MELHQLRCFVMVAEELHFGRAAQRLFMTQPPLSRQIQLLERSLGVQLLDRSNRQVRLTVAGRQFLRDAQHLLAYTEQASDSARRLASGEAGQLVIGFTAVSGYNMVPELLRAAGQSLPDIGFELHEMVSSDQTEALAANMIDIGFVRHAEPRPGWSYQLASREPLVVVMPDGHPLAERQTLAVTDLAHQPFVMYSPKEGRYFYDCIVGLFASAGVLPRYLYYLKQTHSILGLVRAGLGIGIVPASARELYIGHLQFRPLADAQLSADMYMVYRDDNDNPALPRFINMARGHFSEQQTAAPL
ncbi:LysR family transcriptional regulator [Pseudomonas sp. StFLB209]|uniref:LysR family transcriptional regulator n=1 Tax=Pseudomonas sp. StFLB209 TaxID=1028989 RepID=UPI0018D38590|nr:LysR family transcriptional regulator [Pseudomonas sp. StFLB209]